MTEHPSSHDELLQALLVGDRSLESEEFRQQLEDCAECRLRVEEFRSLEHFLKNDGAGKADDATLADLPVEGASKRRLLGVDELTVNLVAMARPFAEEL